MGSVMGATIGTRRDTGSDADASFLGVTSSARGFRWLERLQRDRAGVAQAIAQQHDLPELLGRVLAARGIDVADVPTVLDPTIRALMPDPSTLTDMDKAANHLADAIMARQRVAIFGDYDVDGACSSALLARFLSHHQVPNRIYIPDRLFEGYGPNTAAIESLVREGAQLIVTVDCGTTSFEPLQAARRLGANVLVIDHHQADPELPDVHALVNPNRQDDLSGLGHLCAAGVVFLVLVATARELRRRGCYASDHPEPALLDDLDLVALATVCDVVPLKTLNRAYVTKGLAVMRQRKNVGLRALFDAAALAQPPTPYTLGFVLGPRINAGGRIGDSALGAKLLTTEDEMEAGRIAVLLDKLNRERKAIESEMLAEATAEAEACIAASDPPMLLLASERWHKGVVGLVASRLVERFGRPACVIAWDDNGSGLGTGSLRSVASVDIGAAVRAAAQAGYLIKGGGHAMAAGLTVSRDKLPLLGNFMVSTLSASAGQARRSAGLEIDGALTPSGVDNELLLLLERAGPYGQGNPQPRFVFPAHRVRYAKIAGEAHVRCLLEAGDGSRLDAVAFRAVGQPLGALLMGANGLPLHIAGTLRRDQWGGRDRIELTIEDAADPRQQGH